MLDPSAVLNFVQIALIVAGGGLIYGQQSTHLKYLRQSVDALKDIPETVVRHDERLKVLERK